MSRIVATSSSGPGASDSIQRELSSPSFSQAPELSPLSSTLDGLTTHFVDQATDPITLTAMMAGGMAFRLGRMGVMGFSVGAYGRTPAMFVSNAVGLGSEVTAFEFTNRTLQSVGANLVFARDRRDGNNGRSQGSPLQASNLWNWSGPDGWREGLLSSLITFGTLRGIGSLAQGQNLVFQHALQSTAMVTGHQLSAAFGLTPRQEGDLAAQFLHAEATNLQLAAGMGLVHSLAPALNSFPSLFPSPLKGEGVRHRRTGEGDAPPRISEEGWAMATEGVDVITPDLPSPGLAPYPSPMAGVYSMNMGGDGAERGVSPGLPTPERRQELIRQFTPRLPPMGDPKIYSDEIIERVVATSSENPHFHERLLEALSLAPNPGLLSYRHTADAIKRTFLYNSLNTSTGTLENALLQHLITQLTADENGEQRLSRLHDTFREMETGLTRASLSRLLHEAGTLDGMGSTHFPSFSEDFLIQHLPDFRSALSHYDYAEQVQIFNFAYQEFEHDPERARRALEFFGEARESGRYSNKDIDRALRYARQVPFGRIVLRRMLSVFMAEDVPSKLKELGEEPEALGGTLDLLQEWTRSGLSPQAMAEGLRGTRHTAYMDDPRLALKLVSSMSFFAKYFQRSPQERSRWRSEFMGVIQAHLRSGEELTPARMIDLADYYSIPLTRSLRAQWERGAFEIRFLTNEEMDDLLRQWKQVPMEVSHIFRLAEGSRPHQILIRELAPSSPSQPVDSYSGRVMVTHRLHGLVHEFEHWRHFTGNFDGIEAGGKPFQILSLGREGRLTTEMMAFLEENQWVSLHLTESDWEIAKRMGLNLPLYYRTMADQAYYGRTNERLAREW